MSFLSSLLSELGGFFGLTDWIRMIQSNDYSALRTAHGLLNAVGPLLPALLVFEILRALWTKSFNARQYRSIALIYVFNRVFALWLAFSTVAFTIGLLIPFAPFSVEISWYGLVYGYLVWELGHFIYHYLAHKVRLLWCLHSTHHAPENMNLFVGHSHFFLEGPYAEFIRTATCILLGLSPPLLILIMAIDGMWGLFIHAGENLLKDGRLGWLERWILTPAHHRVHHARNPVYVDRNYCNLLNIWDRLFGTFENERPDVPPEYGINRKVDAGSFWDIYFGEIVLLAKDVGSAPRLVDKLRYIVMPPGWSHTGRHKTAAMLRQDYLSRYPASADPAGQQRSLYPEPSAHP